MPDKEWKEIYTKTNICWKQFENIERGNFEGEDKNRKGGKEMDYSLAALKLLCAQLKNARQTPSQKAFTLGSILFQRAWLQVYAAVCVCVFEHCAIAKTFAAINPKSAGFQGVIVSIPPSPDSGENGRFLLDDGTGVIELFLSRDFRSRDWESGRSICFVLYLYLL